MRAKRVTYLGCDGREYRGLRLGSKNGLVFVSYVVPGVGTVRTFVEKRDEKSRLRARKEV